MIIKYSWLLYKKVLSINKLFSFHYLLIIPGTVIVSYIFLKKVDNSVGTNPLSYVIYYVFLAQTFLIAGKRIKNEYFFSSRCYTIFPLNKFKIVLFCLLFGTIDLNVILQLIVTLGSVVYFTNWDFSVYLILLMIFIIGELLYLISMMAIIEYIIEKFGTSKNIFIITFMPFFFFEFYARMAEKFYLMDYYPVSGWISSTVSAFQAGNSSLVLFYFCISIIGVLVGLLFLDKVFFPKKNNVF